MNQLTLAYPYLLLLLPLPLLVYWLVPPHVLPRASLVVPFLGRLMEHSGQKAVRRIAITRGGLVRRIGLMLGWICVVLAMARPQLIEPPITKQIPMRDMLLAVDLSGSMEATDFKQPDGKVINRLQAVKEVVGDFLSHRKGDRVGLILFGNAPFVQVPLTEDLAVCRQLLDEAQVRMAGPQTAIGDAIGLAINTFERAPKTSERVLILLTDGNDTSSQVAPAKAAQIASDAHIIIHTISVGDPKAVGEDALDIPTLQNISTTTGGLYAHADNLEQLKAIYTRLDALEPQKVDTITHRPRRDIYWWPLAAGFAFSIVQQLLQLALYRHRPVRAKYPVVSAKPVV